MEPRFREHHARFLGIDEAELAEGRRFFPSRFRGEPICLHAFTACIATRWSGKVVFSVRPAECEELAESLGGGEHALDESLRDRLAEFFSGRVELPAVSRMYRYTLRRDWLRPVAGEEHVRAIGRGNRRLFSDFVANRSQLGRALRERAPLFADERFFGVWVDGERAGYAEVSDLYAGGGNLAVAMRPSRRRRGLGRAAVAAAAKWCLERDVVPVYWVDAENAASIRLAEGLGFRRQTEEITVRYRA